MSRIWFKIGSHHWPFDFCKNLYIKKLTVENLTDDGKEIKLFLGHHFNIYGNEIGDTAAYKPSEKGILHYKGDRYILINIRANKQFGIDQFAVGDRDVWKDAEDGLLSGNPISQGCVGSVVEIPILLWSVVGRVGFQEAYSEEEWLIGSGWLA